MRDSQDLSGSRGWVLLQESLYNSPVQLFFKAFAQVGLWVAWKEVPSKYTLLRSFRKGFSDARRGNKERAVRQENGRVFG